MKLNELRNTEIVTIKYADYRKYGAEKVGNYDAETKTIQVKKNIYNLIKIKNVKVKNDVYEDIEIKVTGITGEGFFCGNFFIVNKDFHRVRVASEIISMLRNEENDFELIEENVEVTDDDATNQSVYFRGSDTTVIDAYYRRAY